MLNRMILAPIVIAVAATASQAQQADQSQELFEVLELPQMIQIMREEGLGYGEEIGLDLFAERISPKWEDAVSQIYDADRMQAEVFAQFRASLEGDDIDSMLAFFTTEPGRTIISLEVSARRALLDEAVEEASKEASAIAIEDETERYVQVKTFVEANDLVETNVVGAMNSNYAFYMGLVDGGAMPQDLTEEQVLIDVWSQEPEIRVNTTEWVYSFLMMAYQPLSDEDLEAYIAFSKTEAGQDLNDAMFEAFDGVFENISRALGLASAEFMTQQDI